MRIKRQLDDTLRACGPDVEDTQRLIGNWAEGGLLNGLAMTQLVDRPVYGVHVKMPKSVFK